MYPQDAVVTPIILSSFQKKSMEVEDRPAGGKKGTTGGGRGQDGMDRREIGKFAHDRNSLVCSINTSQQEH